MADVLYGRNAVREALRAGRRTFQRLSTEKLATAFMMLASAASCVSASRIAAIKETGE